MYRILWQLSPFLGDVMFFIFKRIVYICKFMTTVEGKLTYTCNSICASGCLGLGLRVTVEQWRERKHCTLWPDGVTWHYIDHGCCCRGCCCEHVCIHACLHVYYYHSTRNLCVESVWLLVCLLAGLPIMEYNYECGVLQNPYHTCMGSWLDLDQGMIYMMYLLRKRLEY